MYTILQSESLKLNEVLACALFLSVVIIECVVSIRFNTTTMKPQLLLTSITEFFH